MRPNLQVDIGAFRLPPVRGWRLAFVSGGLASVLLAALLQAALPEVPREAAAPSQAELRRPGGVLALLARRAAAFGEVLQAPGNKVTTACTGISIEKH
jgi:predicted MFS family arabinose efflux permease